MSYLPNILKIILDAESKRNVLFPLFFVKTEDYYYSLGRRCHKNRQFELWLNC